MSTGTSNSIEVLYEKMEGFIKSKTVVGEPVHFGDVVILPLIDISFCCGAGGANIENKGSSGGAIGAKMTPSAVLAIVNGTVQLVDVKNTGSANKLIDMIPGILSKLNLDKFLKKDEPTDAVSDEAL